MGINISESSTTQAIDRGNYNQFAVDRGGVGSPSYNVFDNKMMTKHRSADELDKIQKGLIAKYRKYSQFPKVADAITDIKNEMIPQDVEDIIKLNTEYINSFDLDSDKIVKHAKEKFPDLFREVLDKLHFNMEGEEYGEQFYTDGGLYVYYEATKKVGITEIRILDPLKLQLIKDGKKLLYIYVTGGLDDRGNEIEEKIPYDNIIFIPSGLVDPESGVNIGHLNKAIRPINLLHMMENSLVIYRFVRSPERWVFKLDVSGMNQQKGKQYINKIKNQYRNRFVIDAITGEMSSQNMTMAMQENFFIAKTDTQNGGHEIDTVGGNIAGLGEIDDILYFQKEVYKALNVPLSRLETESVVSFGSRLEEINRDEQKFFNFIKTIRKRFNKLFVELLKIEADYRGIMSPDDFSKIVNGLRFIYSNDSIYEENRKRAKLSSMVEVAAENEQFVVKHFGLEYFRMKYLGMTEEEVKEAEKRDEERKKNGEDEEEEE